MSNYNDFICEIITNFGQHRKTLPNPNGLIYERHHIKPRCIGGTDDIFNLIDLTPRDLPTRTPSNDMLAAGAKAVRRPRQSSSVPVLIFKPKPNDEYNATYSEWK